MNKDKSDTKNISCMALIVLLIFFGTGYAADYHVGPGQTYTKLAGISWSSLSAGDTVYIHYGIYHEKFNISTSGTAQYPIRVIGVPDANGNRPIIDGQNATTPASSDFRWQTPNVIQWDGVVFITVNDDDTAPLPGYIEIRNLEIRNGYSTYTFFAENGTSQAYEGFAAGIYIRSAHHVLIDNNFIHNCGQGVYNWTGPGSSWWDGMSSNITLRGNYFYGNGHVSSWTEHQTYTEADNVIIEYNRYGANRTGAYGSQLKDRSAGTIIRYNLFETTSQQGWTLDLVEPEESWDALGGKSTYKQAHVYGNTMINKGNYDPNFVHWNEDHQVNRGRATLTGAKLLFYGNTIISVANQSDMGGFYIFNTTYGAFECPPAGSVPGIIDVRNNIFAALPRTAGSAVPQIRFGYCSSQNFNFGKNWASPGWVTGTSGTVTGISNIVSPTGNNPGFVNVGTNDLHLAVGSSAIGIGGALAPEVVSNYLGFNLTPTLQYVDHQQVTPRASSGIGSDVGAFSYGSSPEIRTPVPPIIRGVSP